MRCPLRKLSHVCCVHPFPDIYSICRLFKNRVVFLKKKKPSLWFFLQETVYSLNVFKTLSGRALFFIWTVRWARLNRQWLAWFYQKCCDDLLYVAKGISICKLQWLGETNLAVIMTQDLLINRAWGAESVFEPPEYKHVAACDLLYITGTCVKYQL